MDELKLQARIVKEVQRKKGWAIKMANRHQGGVPDLFIKIITLPPVFIECKKDKLSLTKLQQETLRRLHAANMPAGWLVHKQERHYHNLYVGADPNANEPRLTNSHLITMTGKEWEVAEIVIAITYWSEVEIGKIG